MGVITQEKSIYKGDTPTFTFTIYNEGSAYDLTGATVAFSAKTSTSATTYQFNKTCTLSSDPTDGTCTVSLTATDTNTAGIYTAEVQVTTSGSAVLTVVQFTLNILATVIA